MTIALLLMWLWMEPPANSVGASEVRPGGSAQRSLTGAGVTVGLWDKGVPLYIHEDFVGRLLFPRPGTTDGHATAVAGIVNGASVGLAPGATVRPFIYNTNDLDSMRAASTSGIRLSAHPYQYPGGWEYQESGWAEMSGCSALSQWRWRGVETDSPTEDVLFNRYTTLSALWDAMLHDHPQHLAVVAAGNHQGAGPASQPVRHCYYSYSLGSWTETELIVRDLNAGMTAMAVSKNTLTVSTWPNDATSSRGFTDDGRIKPDIVAPGSVDNAPSASANDAYGTFSKTSAATAVAAGGIALIHEHLEDVLGAAPLASTVKALVIHTARDQGDTGPDAVHGWGLLDVENAVRVASVDQVVETTLANGQTYDLSIDHSGFGELVATLVWTDPEGTTNDVLVNDLDLRIVGQSAADNTTDVVEQRRHSGLSAGSYTVRVTHKGTLASPQSFSLIVSSGATQRRVFALDAAGWRLISVPFESAPFSRISDSFTTQFGGEDGDATLYLFTEDQGFVAVTDPDTLTQPGFGYLLYVFDSDAPADWVMNGAAVTGPLTRPLPWNGAPASSFALAGNPFHGVLDWDAVVAASTGIANTYYIWDPSTTTGGGTSGFRHYTAGNPGSGDAGRYIPAFSGFFVFATQDDAELVLDPSALVKGAVPVFVGKETRGPQVRLSDGIDEVVVSVLPDALSGWDRYDVPQPAPLDGRTPLALLDDEGVELRVMAVPKPESEMRIRLSAPARITHADIDATVVGDVLILGRASDDQPTSIAVLQAWPNPFNPITTIGFVAEAQDLAPLRITVHDVLGRQVAVLVDAVMEPGEHSVTFDATNLASGVYLVRMTDRDGKVRSLTLSLLK
jgi:hypothetical protein